MKKSESAKKRRRLLQHDKDFLSQGFQSLAGVDEVGRGPLAGPVVASAVIVRDFLFSSTVDDSKKMTPHARAAAYEEILQKCVVGVAVIEHHEIDRINILEATFRAMEEAVIKLGETPDGILIDGTRTPRLPFCQFPIAEGDGKSFSIACASIVAKVTRDRMMDYYDEIYPHYGFRNHKGYGTEEHVNALKQYGPCRIHRKTFEPVKSLLR